MGPLAPVATVGVCCGGGVVECTVVGPGALAAAKKGSRGKITEARIVSKGTHARNDSRHLDGIPFNGFATARHHARNPSKMASSSLFAVLASCCVIALSAGRSVEVRDWPHVLGSWLPVPFCGEALGPHRFSGGRRAAATSTRAPPPAAPPSSGSWPSKRHAVTQIHWGCSDSLL